MGDIPVMDAYREHTEPLPSSVSIWLRVSIWLPGMILIAVFGGWVGFVIAGVLMQ